MCSIPQATSSSKSLPGVRVTGRTTHYSRPERIASSRLPTSSPRPWPCRAAWAPRRRKSRSRWRSSATASCSRYGGAANGIGSGDDASCLERGGGRFVCGEIYMHSNPVIETLLRHASVRKFRDRMPDEEMIATVVRAGQQAPFAMQLGSVILQRGGGFAWGAPLNFIICADAHRIRLIARQRGWDIETCDLSLLLFAIQDAAYMAQNMVVAAESLGLGTCYIGSAPMLAPKIVAECHLPPKVFPLVMLVMGYPAESPPPRPRYPLSFTLFEERYPSFSQEQLDEAMRVMDEGYLAQDYYKADGLKLPVPEDREDRYTFDDYSWTEHISRKMQWAKSPEKLLEHLRACGFELGVGTPRWER
ncbi:MAG: hypothetical protein GF330_04120 [Candidatus Eisenbacteria bacterium]|nr:hypothetical protein [Candidatus Eisenbacteria bacterium]